jgi:hypothetical protein
LDSNEVLKAEDIFREVARENVGMPMIYEALEACREYLITLNNKHVSTDIENKEIESKKYETELGNTFVVDNAITSYTPVNQETFSKWLFNFSNEIKQIKEKEKSDKDLKLTGRQWFNTKDYLDDDAEDAIEDDVDEDNDKAENGDNDEDEDDEKPLYYDEELFIDDGVDDVEFD